ncbi:hypothetical protein EfmAA55_17100 [Enterococcus faecium]|nr:hypothetical protein EfmAA55_17100 [Enterococcus faecium]
MLSRLLLDAHKFSDPDELAELPLEAFCDLLQEKGKGRFKQPEKIAKAIQRAITMSYRLGALAQESINVVR